ncbi:unnamed protein product, partial [marine sediment metagenome]
MSRQFQRKIRVTIQSESEGINQFVINPDLTTQPFEDLKVVFNGVRTRTKERDSGSIEIYNLSKSQRDRISEISKSKPEVVLEAGYMETEVEKAMLADIDKPVHERIGTEWRTTLTLSDGGRALRGSRFKKSYKGLVPT